MEGLWWSSPDYPNVTRIVTKSWCLWLRRGLSCRNNRTCGLILLIPHSLQGKVLPPALIANQTKPTNPSRGYITLFSSIQFSLSLTLTLTIASLTRLSHYSLLYSILTITNPKPPFISIPSYTLSYHYHHSQLPFLHIHTYSTLSHSYSITLFLILLLFFILTHSLSLSLSFTNLIILFYFSYLLYSHLYLLSLIYTYSLWY